MIIDVRGTHGSGKSWVMHSLIGMGPSSNLTRDGQVIGTRLHKYNAAVVGSYQRVCGGCDGVGRAHEVCERVRLFNEQYKHVLLEGIMVAHTFKRYSDLATELGNYVFCFLDTPLEVCIERVIARRVARGNLKEFDPRNVIKDWHNIWENVRGKMEKAGHTVIVLNHKKPLPKILELLK